MTTVNAVQLPSHTYKNGEERGRDSKDLIKLMSKQEIKPSCSPSLLFFLGMSLIAWSLFEVAAAIKELTFNFACHL